MCYSNNSTKYSIVQYAPISDRLTSIQEIHVEMHNTDCPIKQVCTQPQVQCPL